MTENDNKKEAVSIGVTLSTQLISGSLTLIAVMGAISSFFIDKKAVSWPFYALLVVGFIFFICSIYCAGKGIDISRKKGGDGDWSISHSKSFFNFQAIFLILGLVCFGSLFISASNDKEDRRLLLEDKKLELREKELSLIEQLHQDRNSLEADYMAIKKEMLLMKDDIEVIKTAIKEVRQKNTAANNHMHSNADQQ